MNELYENARISQISFVLGPHPFLKVLNWGFQIVVTTLTFAFASLRGPISPPRLQMFGI